jgi:pilus assembly protein CpaB
VRRRVVAAFAAVVLAALGSILLARYVAVADERAMAGLEPVTVLVVTEPIAQGTPAEELEGLVSTRAIPVAAVSPGAVTALEDLQGRVAATDLVAGEQLLEHRFTEPEELAAPAAALVPPGMHQVTIPLDAARSVGGHLSTGDTVGVLLSHNTFEETHLQLHKVLVTRVQGGISAPAAEPAPKEAGAPAPGEPVPADTVLVTLALDAAGAQKVAFAAEFGSVWLSLEDAAAPEDDPGTVTRENLFS